MTTFIGFWLLGFVSMSAGVALRGWIGRGIVDGIPYDSRYLNGILVAFVVWPLAVLFGLYVMLGDMKKQFLPW